MLTHGKQDWQGYCCSCYYEREKQKAQGYTDYQQVYQQKVQEQQERIQQLKLLRNYAGCKHCDGYAVDACELYENNKLVCQPCLAKKESGSASPISFAEQSQWYQKRWGIKVGEWLDKYQCLPVNAKCAAKWLKDKQHWKNCACLEQAAQETHELFTNSLQEKQEKLTKCRCETSEKVRVNNDNYTKCEGCEKYISAASKKRVIKNRNDPHFWGLNVIEKVLCGDCLETRKKGMKPLRRAKFNEYRKLGRL